MRIEAELDDIHAERLLEIQRESGKPLSDLVSEMIAKAIDKEPPPETEGQKILRLLEEHGLLGCMEGDGHLSENYKKYLWGQSK